MNLKRGISQLAKFQLEHVADTFLAKTERAEVGSKKGGGILFLMDIEGVTSLLVDTIHGRIIEPSKEKLVIYMMDSRDGSALRILLRWSHCLICLSFNFYVHFLFFFSLKLVTYKNIDILGLLFSDFYQLFLIFLPISLKLLQKLKFF